MNKVVKASNTDATSICVLIGRESQRGSVLKRTADEVEEVINTSNKGAFFVCKDGKKVIACAGIEIYTPRLAEVRSVVVSETYRGNGLGKQLITKCLDYGQNKKITKIIAYTDKIDFFKKLGFKEYLKNQKVVFLSYEY